MKRLISVVLALAICASLMLVGAVSTSAAVVASGNCGADGDNVTWTLDDAGTLTIGGTGKMFSYNTGFVQWEGYLSQIKSLVIEDGVTLIANYDLAQCKALESVSVTSGNAVYYSENNCIIEKETGELVFGCRNSVIPNDGRVKSIAGFAFVSCAALASVDIPESITSIGEKAFNGCTSLTSIKVPSSVTFIDDGAFGGCKALETIELPDSITVLNDELLRGCTALETIEIPESITSIGSGAFLGCTSLKSIKIPSSVTFIGSDAFSSCEALETIEIPSSVEAINNGTFRFCTSLTDVKIQDGVKSIGSFAFEECTALKTIEIPPSVTSMLFRIPDECDNLTIYGYIGSEAEAYANEYEIPFVATGCVHAATEEKTVAATCTAEGTKSVVCTACGATLSTEAIPALGHKYADGACAVCNEIEEGKKAPQTSDEIVYIIAAMASVMCLGFAVVIVRKKKEN